MEEKLYKFVVRHPVFVDFSRIDRENDAPFLIVTSTGCDQAVVMVKASLLASGVLKGKKLCGRSLDGMWGTIQLVTRRDSSVVSFDAEIGDQALSYHSLSRYSAELVPLTKLDKVGMKIKKLRQYISKQEPHYVCVKVHTL